jgi:hypothetical protein
MKSVCHWHNVLGTGLQSCKGFPLLSILDTNPPIRYGRYACYCQTYRLTQLSMTAFIYIFFLNSHSWGVESKLVPLGTSATEWPILPAPCDYDDGEFVEIKIGRGNRSTRRKSAPAPLCPPHIPLDQARDRTRAAAMKSQRLTA